MLIVAIVTILLMVLVILASVIGRVKTNNNTSQDVGTESTNTKGGNPGNAVDGEVTSRVTRSVNVDLPKKRDFQRVPWQDTIVPSASERPEAISDRFQRPPTPAHYRSQTPIYVRPVTPVNRKQQNPAVPVDRASPNYKQLNAAIANAVLEHDSGFVNYHELSEHEKLDVLDLNQYTIDVDRSVLDPILSMIELVGDGRSLEYVIAHCDKKNDKQLSVSEKQLRKSFRIKHQQSNLCRFPRFRITNVDFTHYRLVFNDYTPYVEGQSPRIDVFKQELSTERSRWETITVSLHHNSELTNIKQIQILVPADAKL